MQFICYPKCTTCQKAKRWLTENDIAFDERNIRESYDLTAPKKAKASKR